MKLGKSQLPSGHTFADFKAFGPVASKDGEFAGTKMADFGCFKQGETNSNKSYFAAVVQSKINQKWFTYFEWGRTGNSKKDFQFQECGSETEAQNLYEKQCHAKNDKRGMWTEVCGIQTLQAKPKKDVYLVRQMTSRSVNIDDAKNISSVVQTQASTTKPTTISKYDKESTSLLRDLIGGTVNYTRLSMSNDALPSADSIDLGRKLICEAQKYLSTPNDKTLQDITYELYARIPKKLGRKENWLLSADNILEWQNDLDAYESALSCQNYEESSDDFGTLPFDVKYISRNSDLGEFLWNWWEKSTLNKHTYLGKMKIKGVWEIFKDDSVFKQSRTKIKSDRKPEKILFQEDIKKSGDDKSANVNWLFHGSRSSNIIGILKEGLRLPRQLSGVHITGALFGGGIYWADDWKKSAGYTSLQNSYWSAGGGSISNRSAFMFTGEVILGNMHVSGYGYYKNEPPSGYHSVMGKAGQSGVQNNEYIVYNTSQAKLRYLVEFDA